MKFGTVRSCQNDQKFPQKLTKLSDHFLPEVKNGGTPEVKTFDKRGGTLGVKSGGAGGSKKVNLLLLQEVTSLLREDIFKHCGCSDTMTIILVRLCILIPIRTCTYCDFLWEKVLDKLYSF